MNGENIDLVDEKENDDDNGKVQMKIAIDMIIQCPPLNRITLGLHKSDNNNRMIQLTDVFCVLLMYNGISNI